MPSWTAKPCDGCGESGRREAGKVCLKCQTELQIGRDRVAWEEQGAMATGAAVVWEPRRFDYISGLPSVFESEVNDELERRFKEIVPVIAAQVRFRDVYRLGAWRWGETGKDTEAPVEHVYRGEDKEVWKNVDEFLLTADAHRALAALEDAVRDAIQAAHLEGYEDGSSILHQLGAGELGETDFEDRRKRTMQREEADRKRRHAERMAQDEAGARRKRRLPVGAKEDG